MTETWIKARKGQWHHLPDPQRGLFKTWGWSGCKKFMKRDKYSTKIVESHPTENCCKVCLRRVDG